MANIHKWFSKLFHFILILIFIPCGKSTKLNPIFFNFNQIKGRALTRYQKKTHCFQQEKNLLNNYNNILDIVFGSITDESHNWMNNRECFSELLVIKNAFNNFDEWAIESKVWNFDHNFFFFAKLPFLNQKLNLPANI